MENLTNQIFGILVTQAVVGALALIGLVAIIRRFMNTEFPAVIATVNRRLDTLHEDFEEMRKELLQIRRDVDRDNVLLEDTRMRLRDVEGRERSRPRA